jgi:hypothetical protein
MPDTLPSSHCSLKTEAVIFGATADTLSGINDAPVSLAVWERPMPSEVVRWLDETHPETLPTARFVCHHFEARKWLTQALSGKACDSNPAGLQFKEDIVGLIERFARIRSEPWIEVRLEVISDNACAKFHADNVSVRLLTTYRGPATEWLDPAIEFDACCSEAVPEAAVRRLPRFAAALVKGRKARSRSGPLVLHRSPPIEGTGHVRLLLCVSDAEPDRAWTT